MADPTPQESKAVRRVIYKRARVRRLRADYSSIMVLMNIRNPGNPDGGPLWIIPATGEPGFSIKESVKRCRSIADTLQAASVELGDVEIPDADRRNLRTALDATAQAWRTRAAVWERSSPPDPESAVARIARHHERGLRAMAKVEEYLLSGEAVDDLLGAR